MAVASPNEPADAHGDHTDLSTDDVGVSVADNPHVATVEVRRGPHNFLDGDVLERVVDVSYELASRDVRALVLCSEGRNFCGGASFGGAGVSGSGRDDVYEVGIRLLEQPLPIIAAVQGAAVGGGLGLALMADFRVASPESRFAANFSLLGIHPGFGLSVTLPLAVGHSAAIDLMYTGRRIGGEEALRIGLCDHLVAADHLRARAVELATEISMGAPLAVSAIRKSMRGSLIDSIRAAMEKELEIQKQLMQTEDFREGVSAVNERRPAEFEGC